MSPDVSDFLADQVVKVYQDKKNWKPPSYKWIADKLGIGKAAVHYALKRKKIIK